VKTTRLRVVFYLKNDLAKEYVSKMLFFIRKHDVIQLEKIKREYYEIIFHYIVFNILFKSFHYFRGSLYKNF